MSQPTLRARASARGGAPSTTIAVDVLGPIAVTVDGETVSRLAAKQREVLAILVVAGGRPVSGAHIAEELWGAHPPATATTALQVHLSALRKVLGGRIERTPSGYRLAVDEADLDAARFESLIGTARQRASERPEEANVLLATALGLWRGRPYDGGGDAASVERERQRLVGMYESALDLRYEMELDRGRHGIVVDELRVLAARNPTNERIAAHTMLALYRCGRVAEAEACFAALERALTDELGAEPGGRVTALAEAIRHRDPTLDLNPSSSVPAPTGRFVGRRWELDELGRLLGGSRLVTLVGPGGSGKTRLANQLAREMADRHPDGTFWVELADLADAAGVLPRIAAVLSVREHAGRRLLDGVSQSLRAKRVLLVVDNCEHVVEACAGVVGELLRRSSVLRVLVTTRIPLGVEGERTWPVFGLAVPDGGAAPQLLKRSDAVRLLAERGAAARSGFAIDDANVRTAVEICRRLDGLPLAIEMVAARLRGMSLPDIEQRLVHRLDLAGSAHDRSALGHRHRTMRTAIDWSHELLSADEQRLFRRLSVFAGGWTLTAAEQVTASGDAGDLERERVAELLVSLIDQSLVSPPGPSGERYGLLETVHEYAAERLDESGERDAVARRHATWVREVVQDCAAFGGDTHLANITRLRAEEDNVVAALTWTLGHEPDMTLALCGSFWWFWWMEGRLTEGREWMSRALAAASQEPTAVRAAVLHASAALARSGGEFDAARTLEEQAKTVGLAIQDGSSIAAAFNGLCLTEIADRNFAEAIEHGVRARDVAELVGDPRAAAAAINNVGIALRCLDRLDEADELFAEAAQRCSALGDHRGRARALNNKAAVALKRADHATARALAGSALEVYSALQMRDGQVDVIETVACADAAENADESALLLLTVADRVRAELGETLFAPDLVAERERARRGVTERVATADEIARVARSMSLETVAANLLGRLLLRNGDADAPAKHRRDAHRDRGDDTAEADH